MGQKDIKFIYYADDTVKIAKNEDDVQRMLFKFS